MSDKAEPCICCGAVDWRYCPCVILCSKHPTKCLNHCACNREGIPEPGAYSYDGELSRARDLKQVLTKQIAFGRSEPKSIDGPLFAQPGLFD